MSEILNSLITSSSRDFSSEVKRLPIPNFAVSNLNLMTGTLTLPRIKPVIACLLIVM